MITTNSNNKYFTDAENETFAWESYRPDELTHKPSGRNIYQMRWVDDNGMVTDFVSDDIRQDALAFFSELEAAKSNLTTTTTSSETETESTWYKINEHGEKELKEDY